MDLIFDSAPNCTIGINEYGTWSVTFSNGDAEAIDSIEMCYHLIVCLQKNREEVLSSLEDGVRRSNLPAGLVETFPVVEGLKFALQSKTGWVENAVAWLDIKDMNEVMEATLREYIEHKAFSQVTRHKAFKILKGGKRIIGVRTLVCCQHEFWRNTGFRINTHLHIATQLQSRL